MSAKRPEPPDEGALLNEQARLYPWRCFNQGELQKMTGYPREVISAAFDDPQTPCQFGRARPEQIAEWVWKQPKKILAKEV